MACSCHPGDMTPAFFVLYDVLDLAATAVDEDVSGRWRNADRVWVEACRAADDLFPEGSDTAKAAGVILRAAAPSGKGSSKPELWNALDAASKAALNAMTGDGPGTALLLRDAEAAADALTPELRDAMTVLAAEIGLLAMTAVAA
jgi:hypothetical protein